MKEFRNFPSLHVHPQSLDSASTPEAFAKKEVELGTGVLTCTDHGSLGAAYKTYELAKKNKLTPAISLEGYFRDDNCPILTKSGIQKTNTIPRGMDKDKWLQSHPDGSFFDYSKYQHLTLGFKTYNAYLTAVKLLSKADDRAETHGSERKPLFTWDDIEELASTETILGSGCLVGIISRHLIEQKLPINERVEIAKKYFEKLIGLFGKNFYIELFPHVCSHNYVKGVFVDIVDSNGQNPKTLRYYYGKTLKTEKEELSAEQLANKFYPV